MAQHAVFLRLRFQLAAFREKSGSEISFCPVGFLMCKDVQRFNDHYTAILQGRDILLKISHTHCSCLVQAHGAEGLSQQHGVNLLNCKAVTPLSCEIPGILDTAVFCIALWDPLHNDMISLTKHQSDHPPECTEPSPRKCPGAIQIRSARSLAFIHRPRKRYRKCRKRGAEEQSGTLCASVQCRLFLVSPVPPSQFSTSV